MLWCLCCSLNSSKIAHLEGAIMHHFLNFDARLEPNLSQIAPILMQMHNQIRFQKGAGTKMHKCLVGPLMLFHSFISRFSACIFFFLVESRLTSSSFSDSWMVYGSSMPKVSGRRNAIDPASIALRPNIPTGI